jgi:hypothetical protein
MENNINRDLNKETIEKLIADTLFPETQKLKLFTGAGGVREFAKRWYGGSYTWRQLRHLFQTGLVKGGSWWEPVKEKPGFYRRYRGYQL